jgi:hypothetical protein
MMKKYFACLVILGAAGCSTLDSIYQGTVGLTDPDSVKLRGDVEWLNPQPDVRFSDDMTVYLRVRNSSGSEFPVSRLRSQIADNIADAGYQLVRQPGQAQYVLRVNVRGYGEDAAADFSSGTGAAIGGLIGYGVSSNDEYKSAAGVGGAVLGEAVTSILRNRNKQIRIDLVTDLTVGERVEGGVQTTRTTGGNQQLHSLQGDRRAGNTGSSRIQSIEKQVVETTEDFLNHENRLIASAERLKLTPEEALDFLLNKMVGAISGVLP